MMYQGKTGFNWFTGVIEDRNDPKHLNRVRVRIHGSHTFNKQKIATPDLPWSEVMMPVTSPSLSGLGTTTHGLVEGSSVMGFYRDYLEMQDPIVIGSFVGEPQSFYRVDEKEDDNGTRNFTKIERTTTEGYNDPRLSSESSYKGTPDGINPTHIPNRTYGLTLGLDKSPKNQGSDKAINYPRELYLGSSDVNLLARDYDDKTYPIINLVDGEGKQESSEESSGGLLDAVIDAGKSLLGLDSDSSGTPIRHINPKYPFNHVHETESGHVLELDDTPDFERIHLYHRTGTRVEIDKDGSYVEKVVKDKYSVVLGDDTVTISGKVTVNITGDADITVDGATNLISKGDISMVAPKIKLNA